MTEWTGTGFIKDGKLTVRHRKDFEAAMDTFVDGEVSVTITKQRATRSQEQNAYYFGVVLRLLSEHTGHTVDELHEYCKQRFNAKTVLVQDAAGVVVDEQRIGLSTTKLNRVTFGEYLEAIRQWAAEDLHVDIPDPDPNWRQREHAAA